MNPTQISLLLKPRLHNYHIYTFSHCRSLQFWNRVCRRQAGSKGRMVGAQKINYD
jgi:hypothetical protein